MAIYSNVKVVNNGFFKESRLFFDGFDDVNDSNPLTKKVGIRCHYLICALILKLFGKIEKITTSEGKIIFVNKESLNKWKNRHWAALPEEMKSQNLPSVVDIIEGYKKLKIQSEDEIEDQELENDDDLQDEENEPTSDLSDQTDPITEAAKEEYEPTPDLPVRRDLIIATAEKENEPAGELSSQKDLITITDKEENEPTPDLSVRRDLIIATAEKENEPTADLSVQKDLTITDKEEYEDSESQTDKGLSLAHRWGMKVVPEIFPELKAPLAIMKTGQVITDAVEKYQEGDAFGAIKKVAPLAIGGGLLWMGGPVVAAAFTAYKAYNLANLHL